MAQLLFTSGQVMGGWAVEIYKLALQEILFPNPGMPWSSSKRVDLMLKIETLFLLIMSDSG